MSTFLVIYERVSANKTKNDHHHKLVLPETEKLVLHELRHAKEVLNTYLNLDNSNAHAQSFMDQDP